MGSGETVKTSGCRSCHDLDIDNNHNFPCIDCHRGNNESSGANDAHRGLLAKPAAPAHAAEVCGPCHQQKTKRIVSTRHYTLNGHISAIRQAFGAPVGSVPAPTQLLDTEKPASVMELTDDLLRRRCLRCHVYYPGDSFSKTTRGIGCAACHLPSQQTATGSHRFFAAPPDQACLSCHYGNHVGYDYYGRYEHDLNDEYKTPYVAVTDTVPPYGVPYHQLTADVHQQAGMVCIDCHDGKQVMGGEQGPTCSGCHQVGNDPSAGSLSGSSPSSQPGRAIVSKIGTKTFFAPYATHPAHQEFRSQATCVACHALWTFNDGTTHLLRIDHDDLEEFFLLSGDGSSRVRYILESHIDPHGDWLEPTMADTFTGKINEGIWLKGYRQRRWEQVMLVRGSDDRITTARPILDLRLSWIDRNETLRYDNIGPVQGISLIKPYVPHTIGPAGLFYRERLRIFEIEEFSAKHPANP